MDFHKDVFLSSTLEEKNGFIFLPINECLSTTILELSNDPYFVSPVNAIDNDKYVGPHISVFTQDEVSFIKKKKKTIKEIGEKFDFSLGPLKSVIPSNWERVKEVLFISVNSIQLERLRKKYGLKSKINGNDFHITIGVKTKGSQVEINNENIGFIVS